MNAFNMVLRKVIFQKLCVTCVDIIQLILLFVHSNAFEYPSFYNHCNYDGDVIIIPSAMGILQGDPLGNALFALVHLMALCLTTNHSLIVYFHPL